MERLDCSICPLLAESGRTHSVGALGAGPQDGDNQQSSARVLFELTRGNPRLAHGPMNYPTFTKAGRGNSGRSSRMVE